MINLVTLDRAKLHLRIALSNDDSNQDIMNKIAEASDIVMDYIKKKTVPEEWVKSYSPELYEVPPLIQAAVLLVMGELYLNREASVVNVLNDSMGRLLNRYRDPSIA